MEHLSGPQGPFHLSGEEAFSPSSVQESSNAGPLRLSEWVIRRDSNYSQGRQPVCLF